MKATKKAITAEIKTRFGVDVQLVKSEGFYWWNGKATCFFDETCTYIQNLYDYSLERWLEDFESKATQGLYWSDFDTLKQAVELTDWNVK